MDILQVHLWHSLPPVLSINPPPSLSHSHSHTGCLGIIFPNPPWWQPRERREGSVWIFFSPSLNGLISPASLFHSVHWAVFSRYWSHDPRRPSNPTWPPSSMSSSLHVEVPPQSLTPHPPREFSGLSEVIRSFEKKKESGAEESWRQLSELQPLGNEQTNKALKAVVSSLDDLTWRPGECPGVVIYSFFFQKHFTSAGKGKG